MRTIIYLFIICSVFQLSCSGDKKDSFIMTVRGPVPASAMGQWLAHEHIMVDWIGANQTGTHRWVRDSVIDRSLPFLIEIRELGVESFVDCSPAYLGRDPLILLDLSRQTDIHILTNTGYYGAVDNRFIPGHAWNETAEELASRWTEEFEHGIDASGIKPGFIKIGVKEDGPLSDLHARLIRAAAITHKKTGLVIKSHTGGDIPAFEQIELLRQENVSPEAFIWTHAQNGSVEKLLEAAELGVWISLDGVNITGSEDETNTGNMEWYVRRLTEFRDAGLLGQVLISHDAGWYDAGEPAGGEYRGYTDIHRHLLPALRNNGFSLQEIEMLVSDNPARAFTIRVRQT